MYTICMCIFLDMNAVHMLLNPVPCPVMRMYVYVCVCVCLYVCI